MDHTLIDQGQLKLISDGDREFEIELLMLFKKDASNRISNIFEAHLSKASAKLERELHTLRGAAANVGAGKIEKLCIAIEKSHTTINFEDLKLMIEDLDKATKETFSEIDSLIGT